MSFIKLSFSFIKRKKDKKHAAEEKKQEVEEKGPSLVIHHRPFSLKEHYAEKQLTPTQFRIGETLGTGTFGRVRLVCDTVEGQQQYFALKILKKQAVLKLKQVEHIKAEKSILMRITHPFIINLYGHFKDTNNLYMLMEYAIGGELFSILRRAGRFAPDTARFYAAEICLVFEYLHSLHIAYRDLKPENILLDREGHVKVTDFGFAKVVEDRTWTLCGTPEYLAPEIIMSRGHGCAVDWWAFGILIYEMLAGFPPYSDESHIAIYQKIIAGNLQFPSGFDPVGRDLVSKLLVTDRTKRYGCLKDGALDVKRHKWFEGIDWERCYDRKLPAPYVPSYRGPSDTANFDRYPDSPVMTSALSEADLAKFDDF